MGVLETTRYATSGTDTLHELAQIDDTWFQMCAVSDMETYPLILIANEPGTYRSLLASELPFLRPNLRIQEIAPEDLETVLPTLHPAVVLCSRAPEHVLEAEVTILVLHTGEVEMSLQSGDGAIANPQLSDILAAVDQAVAARTPATPQ